MNLPSATLGNTQVKRTKHYCQFMKDAGYDIRLNLGKNIGHGLEKSIMLNVATWIQEST